VKEHEPKPFIQVPIMTCRVISLSGQLTLMGISPGTIQLALDLTVTPNGDSVVRKGFCCEEHRFVGNWLLCSVS